MAVVHCFLMTELYSIVCMCVCVCVCVCVYNIFLIQTSTDDHLGCYHVLNIINSKAVNVGAHASFQFSVTFF